MNSKNIRIERALTDFDPPTAVRYRRWLQTLAALALTLCLKAQANMPNPGVSAKRFGDSPLAFIENRGQFDPAVKFQVKSGGKVLWFTETGVVFDLLRPAIDKSRVNLNSQQLARVIYHPGGVRGQGREPFERLVFAEDFVNANTSSLIDASGPQRGVYNYLIGSDPAAWHTGIRRYSQIVYRDVWPGIDIRFFTKGDDIEQEFLVAPRADPALIHVHYRGVIGLEITSAGRLSVQTIFGRFEESVPWIYQEIHGRQVPVRGRYLISNNTAYAFQLGRYNRESALVIDPTLLFSTYIGGLGTEGGAAIAVDTSGSTYITGTTTGSGYPSTTGVLQSTCQSSGCSSGFVTKLNPVGDLAYSTYLGSPTGDDEARGIAVDGLGEAYVVGFANGGFPTTSNAFQANCGGSTFVSKLNSSGTSLVYSTCLGVEGDLVGGTFGQLGANAIALDTLGRAYLTGRTQNNNFPTTSSALQATLPGSISAYLSVVDPSLTGSASLVYSTHLGGEGQDSGNGIAVDIYGNAYISGNTTSSHFPVSANAFQQTNNQPGCYSSGNNNKCNTAFVAKLNPNFVGGSGLIYSSYLGGDVGNDGGNSDVGDYGYGIAVDSLGNAYIGGTTNSSDFPTTSGAFQKSTSCGLIGSPAGTGFVTKVNAGGSALIYSTFLGPTANDCGAGGVGGITLDSSANVYVVGSTRSTTFPVTANAFQAKHVAGGLYGYDAFISELSSSGSGLVYSSYLGGNGDDYGVGVAVDAVGDVYLTGITASPNFPVTPLAHQGSIAGSATSCPYNTFCPDVFVTKFPLGAPGGLSIIGMTPTVGGNAGTVSPQIVGSGFHAGVAAQLNCGGQSIMGTNATVSAGGQVLNTTFNFTAASPGVCDVVVTNPDGTSATLSRAFTVQQGGAPNIRIYLTGVARREAPNEVAVAPTNAAYFVTVSNLGNVDYAGGFISQPVNQPFALTSVSSGGIATLATLAADSEVVWSAPALPAGASQLFTSTATTLQSVGAVLIAGGVCVALVTVGRAAPEMVDIANCIAQSSDIEAISACGSAESACVAAANDCAIFSEELGETDPEDCIVGLHDCITGIIDCATSGGPVVQGCIQQSASRNASYLTACISAVLSVIAPSDPNNLIGFPGVGSQGWIAGAQALTYEISFGNEPTATAPAQQVVVTQTLGANVNLSTLNLPSITIPNGASSVHVTVPTGSFNPAASLNEFTTNVDLRPTQSLLVNVDAKLTPATQTLTWTFTSIDPITGLPPLNPLVGFLPPGMGANVAFSVTPTPVIATGTQVSEQATVVFDANPSMSTPVWSNTIDNTAPVSQVSALPTSSTCPAFRVSWSGSDVGSGLQGFTVYVSDTGSPFAPWLLNTTAASGDYIGTVGHTYSFYSIATDLVGNIEGSKTTAEASTSVTASGPCGAPSLSGQLSNIVQSGTTVTPTLTLTNVGFTAAQAVNINQMTFRTLSGSGTVTLTSPAVPAAEGPLGIGASMNVPVTLNVPTTVTRFSMTERGTIQDSSGNTYNYSMAQTVIL
jgi:hypothetical protein